MRNINNELKCSSPMYKRFFPSSSSLLPLPTSVIVDLMVNNINCRRGDLTRRNTHKYFSEEILIPPAVAAALGKIRSTHCTVLNSPPTTSLLHWRRTQERSSSSSPSSVIRINCYKGNICTPQILLVFLVVARSVPSPIADSGGTQAAEEIEFKLGNNGL